MVEPFSDQSEYAYFAVRFGWTRAQYLAITPVERAFIRKEIERQTVRDQEILQSTLEIAMANAFGKKGRKRKTLFKKKHKEVSAPIDAGQQRALAKGIKGAFQNWFAPKKKLPKRNK